MIAQPPRDDAAAALISALQMILPRELQRRLDRLGSAARVPDSIERARRKLGDKLGQLLRLGGREKAGVDIFETGRLFADRGGDLGMGMAEAGDRRPATGVDIAAAAGIKQKDPLAANRDRRPRAGGSVKDVIGPHDSQTSARPRDIIATAVMKTVPILLAAALSAASAAGIGRARPQARRSQSPRQRPDRDHAGGPHPPAGQRADALQERLGGRGDRQDRPGSFSRASRVPQQRAFPARLARPS